MILRALLVMLAVLNLGVALWWLARPVPAAPATPALDAPLLQLADAASAPSAACLRYGPFRASAPLEAARAAIAAQVQATATARAFTGPVRAWRVLLPQPSREVANATAERIRAAGFSDLLVLPATGLDAHAIALGRYGNEASAMERVQALRAAGFAAVGEAVGGNETHWLDVRADEGFDATATLGMPGQRIACDGVRAGGRYTIPAPA